MFLFRERTLEDSVYVFVTAVGWRNGSVAKMEKKWESTCCFPKDPSWNPGPTRLLTSISNSTVGIRCPLLASMGTGCTHGADCTHMWVCMPRSENDHLNPRDGNHVSSLVASDFTG